jgi:hypothetical protein
MTALVNLLNYHMPQSRRLPATLQCDNLAIVRAQDSGACVDAGVVVRLRNQGDPIPSEPDVVCRSGLSASMIVINGQFFVDLDIPDGDEM